MHVCCICVKWLRLNQSDRKGKEWGINWETAHLCRRALSHEQISQHYLSSDIYPICIFIMLWGKLYKWRLLADKWQNTCICFSFAHFLCSYFEEPLFHLPVFFYVSLASVTELLVHPTSFVETGRPPSACFDPINRSPSLPGSRERSRCQSADFSLWKALGRLGGTFPARAHVHVGLVTYRVTLVWPSFDMIMPQVRTSERICDVRRISSSIHEHLSKIWMIWSCNNMKIIDHS